MEVRREIRRNILHICTGYPFQSLYQRMHEAFQSHHHQFYVPLAANRRLPPIDFSSDSFRDVVISRDYTQLDRILYYSRIRKVFARLVRQIDLKSVDVIHAHSLFSAGGVAYRLKQQFGIKYAVTVRSTDVNKFFKYAPHLRRFGVSILDNADKVVFLNPPYRDFVASQYVPGRKREDILSRCEVIPNGIDSFWFRNLLDTPRTLKNGHVSLLYVGQFIKRKNVRVVIELSRILKRRGWKGILNLVGDGPEFEQIKNSVGHNRYIRFHGHVSSRDELLTFYRDADIFVMPSVAETFGLVYIEAMSQGLPVIYTRGEAIDGYFPDGMIGFAVEPEAPEQIADRVEELLANYREVSLRCKQVAPQFSWTRVSDTLEQMYSTITGST